MSGLGDDINCPDLPQGVILTSEIHRDFLRGR